MRNQNNFRIVNKFEENIIIDTLSRISPKISTILDTIEYTIFISFNELSLKKNFPIIFLVPNYLSKHIAKLEYKRIIVSAGLYFGFIKKNQFFLSLEGAEFLHSLHLFSERYQLILNNEGEKAILYGNRILKKMVAKISDKLKKNDLVFVFNKLNESIALAQSLIDYNTYQNLNPAKIIALNLIDKGYYLRERQ